MEEGVSGGGRGCGGRGGTSSTGAKRAPAKKKGL